LKYAFEIADPLLHGSARADAFRSIDGQPTRSGRPITFAIVAVIVAM
jgi:hypothetical protein